MKSIISATIQAAVLLGTILAWMLVLLALAPDPKFPLDSQPADWYTPHNVTHGGR